MENVTNNNIICNKWMAWVQVLYSKQQHWHKLYYKHYKNFADNGYKLNNASIDPVEIIQQVTTITFQTLQALELPGFKQHSSKTGITTTQ